MANGDFSKLYLFGLRITEALVTAAVIGGITLYGMSVTIGADIKYITKEIAEMKPKLENVCTAVATHIAAEQAVKDAEYLRYIKQQEIIGHIKKKQEEQK